MSNQDPNQQAGTTQQTTNQPVGASQQTAQPNQQLTLADLIKQFQEAARDHNISLPPHLQVALQTPPSSSPVSSANTDALRMSNALFNANCPPSQGNMWGIPGLSASGLTSLSSPCISGRNTYERVPEKIPIDKFKYGTPGADWSQWSLLFVQAVQAATNAKGRDRLEQLCLLWIPLKLNEEAQPIYDKTEHKEKSWPLLRAELEEAFEDPRIKRQWARNRDAYKKPANMSLQVYRANIIGYVNKYSPALATDPKAHALELYNRFVDGLEVDWRDYIEESIPWGKECLDKAFSQALKYEARLAKKSVDFSAAAMTNAEKDGMEKIRLDVEKLKIQAAGWEESKSSHQSRDKHKSKESKGPSEAWKRDKEKRVESPSV